MTKPEVQLRYAIFAFLLVAVNVGYLLGESRTDVDTCVVAYSTGVLLSFMCWVLYVVWWVRTGRSSNVYAWLTWLFMFICVHMGLALYARYLFLLEPRAAYNLFVDNWLWRWRMFPMSVMLSYMLALVLGRMFGAVEEAVCIFVMRDNDLVDIDGVRLSKADIRKLMDVSVIVED